MDFLTDLALDAFATMVLLFIVVSMIAERDDSTWSRIFTELSVLVLLFASADVLSDAVSYNHHPAESVYAAMLLYYALFGTVCVMLPFSYSRLRMRAIRRIWFPAVLVETAAFALAASAPWNGWVFSAGPDGEIVYGGLFELQMMLSLSPLIYVMADAVRSCVSEDVPQIRRREIMFLAASAIPLAASCLVEMLTDISMMTIGFAFAMTSAYIRVQNLVITTDPLTGLENRMVMDEYLEDAFGRHRGGTGMVVAVSDLDRFKEVVDTYGHYAAGQTLRDVGHVFLRETRDTGCRPFVYGGDEFVIVSESPDDDEIDEVCGRIRDELARMSGEKRMLLHLSIGTARLNPGTESVRELFGRADAAMYGKKQEYYREKGYRRCA